MKKQFMAAGVMGVALLAMAAKSSDPVLMRVAGKDVPLSEFEYLYHKNNAQQVQPQTLDEYVQMFIDYKLKVADAEAAGIDTTAAFVKEFTQFRDELADPYLVDNAVLDSLVEQTYQHLSNDVYVSHIMMPIGREAELDSLRDAIATGLLTFEEVARQYSIDTPSAQRGGRMGWVVPNRYPWPFEEMTYQTALGEISPIVNSGYGIHLIRVEKIRPAREVLVEHILRLTANQPDSVAALEQARIDSIYNVVNASDTDFGDVARRLSQDPGSAANGGRLDWFGSGMMVAEFDSVAFAMPVGTISRPFRTAYGWHIIHKLDERDHGTLEENRKQIISSMGNDERGSLPRRVFTSKMITKYKGRLIEKNFDKIARLADKMGGTIDSTMTAAFAASNIPVFEIGGKKTTLSEIVSEMPVTAVKGGANIANIVRETAFKVMCDRALELARVDLASTNPEYRNLVNEYRDGILLFEISNRNVWQRAAESPELLEQYFAANRDKYKWETPKFKSIIIFANNDSILGEAMNFAAKLPADIAPIDVVKRMREEFGREVKVERVIAAKGENPITDYLAFGGEKPSTDNARWPSYAAFRGRVIPAPEEASDVRGQVVSDFQAALEHDWIESLRAKYPVKINKEVLELVK